ncbi:MAG: tetratricopeptide repeat protein, partial [Planctomycetales bacterium]|nr:tetratricopeptide repeat protein [Planctomycetales bacterium]
MTNVHLQRALMLIETSRFEQAEGELRASLVDDPDESTAHAMLAICLSRREQFDEATGEAQAAVHLAPDASLSHFALASVMRRRNRLPEAADAILEAIRLSPQDETYFGVLADIRYQQRRWKDALAAAEQGLEIDPEDETCVNLKSMALVKLNRKSEAQGAIREALARDPDNPLTHANLGWTYLDQGDPRQALEHFREALRLDPTDEWTKAGMLEALKARYFFYRWLLAYYLWMAKLPRQAQWGVVVGGWIAYEIIRGAARTNPALAPWLTPLIVLYGVFVVMTWVASPLMNLALRLNKYGRYLLTLEQIVSSNLVGMLVAGSLASIVAYAITWHLWLLVAAASLFLCIPSAGGVFRCAAGWPRWAMAAVAAGLFAMGLF